MTDWTTEPPTEPGWYWWKSEDIGIRIMHVITASKDMMPWCATANQSYGPASLIDGEWWPERIPEPAEQGQ